MAQTIPSTVSLESSSRRCLSAGDRERLKQSFADDGYVIVKNVVSKEKLAGLAVRIADEFDAAKRSGRLFAGGGQLTGHLNCFPGEESRFAYTALRDYGILDLVKDVYPLPYAAPLIACNFNMPNSVAQHYHTDSSFLDWFMVVNVAVVDTNLVNGAIDVVPASHKRFYKYWRFVVERPHRHAQRLPLEQGDVLLRASTLWHRGMPNRASVPRPMLAFTFGEKREAMHPDDPYRFNEGKIAFFPNWYRPNFLGRLRERTYIKAPFTYSAYRFVRSLVGSKGYNMP